jgi:hypothetical protein
MLTPNEKKTRRLIALDAEHLRRRAASCRRLAERYGNLAGAAALRELADQFEATAEGLVQD